MAGLGNRLQSLGWALDLALQYHVPLAVDWLDRTWQNGFGLFFEIEDMKILTPGDIPGPITGPITVWPLDWAGRWRGEYIWGDIRQTRGRIDSAFDLIVVCRYNSAHSDELYHRLRLTPPTRTALESTGLAPGHYNAWHIRHTDKKTGDWPAWLTAAQQSQATTGIQSVILTDSLEVQNQALSLGMASPSRLVERYRCGKHHGGVHHVRTDPGTKAILNQSAIADMWLAIKSRQFTACCPTSTFSEFAERMRRVTGKGASHEDSHP